MAKDTMKLVIDEDSSDTISEVLGWKDDVFHSVFRDLTIELLVMDHKTKTQALDAYVKSGKLQKLGVKMDNANDFFMLGFAYKVALQRADNIEDGKAKECTRPISGLMSLLEHVAKR